ADRFENWQRPVRGRALSWRMPSPMASRPIGSPGGVEKLAARRPPVGRDGSPSRPRAPPYHDVSYPCRHRISTGPIPSSPLEDGGDQGELKGRAASTSCATCSRMLVDRVAARRVRFYCYGVRPDDPEAMAKGRRSATSQATQTLVAWRPAGANMVDKDA